MVPEGTCAAIWHYHPGNGKHPTLSFIFLKFMSPAAVQPNCPAKSNEVLEM
jgi:hypothetical protein